ncbi:Na+/H+ antiporter subunit E [Kineococcus terrestris]|uniref:Na+/H+ antiporter subunit E n=1 Tax=Kineococcus terrestris TaxID=2044856 RepID=UPI0034DB2820
MSRTTWPLRFLGFAAWYVKLLLTSYAVLIADELSPGQRSTPGIVRLPTACRTEFEATSLAVLISLTPGTMAFSFRGDAEGAASRRDRTWTLHVHGMYHPDREELRAELHDLEHRVLAALRPGGFVPAGAAA